MRGSLAPFNFGRTACLEALERRTLLSAGALDSSFSGDGIVTAAIGTSDDWARAVAYQPDGKIVAAGYTFNAGLNNWNMAVVRYDGNGGLDASFNDDGIATIDIGGRDDYAEAMAIDAQGRIVVAGYSYDGPQAEFLIARFLANGAPDQSFSGGQMVVSFGAGDDKAFGVAIQNDGKIVVAGYALDGASYKYAVARFNDNATPDNSFGANRKVVVDVGPSDDFAQSALVQPDGKIVVASYSWNGAKYDYSIARLRAADGALDSEFGDLVGAGGRDLLLGGAGADRLVGNADDDILVAGITDFDEHPAALAAILTEWTSARSFAERTANITGNGSGASFASRANGQFFLNTDSSVGAITVRDDNCKDLLTGSAGQDWFFANLFLDSGDDAEQKDKVTDLSAAAGRSGPAFFLDPPHMSERRPVDLSRAALGLLRRFRELQAMI